MPILNLGKCVCGGNIYASDSLEPNYFVVHDVPYCKQFEQMEQTDFLIYIKTSRGIGEN